MQNFDFFNFFFLLLRLLLLKVQFNLVSADILKNHGAHPVTLGKWSKLPGFSISLFKLIFPPPLICKKKGFYEEFARQWSFVAILWINEVGGTCKMNIQIAV